MYILIKYLKFCVFFNLALLCNFYYIPKAASHNFQDLGLDHVQSKEFANFLFKSALDADRIAIKGLYFNNHPEDAKAVLLKAASFYKDAAELDPNHPYAHTFAIAHDYLDGSNNPVEGDKDAQMAVSGLYADGVEVDVPDDTQIQAFWVLKASQNPGTSMPAIQKPSTNRTWITFIENKLVSMFGSVAAGAVGGFTIGQTISQEVGESYWTYVGIGVGAGVGFVGWFCSLNFYNIYHWWTTHRKAKKALKHIDDTIFDVEDDDGPIMTNFDGEDLEAQNIPKKSLPRPDVNGDEIEQNEAAQKKQECVIPISLSKSARKNQQKKIRNARKKFVEFVKKHGGDHDVVAAYLAKTAPKRIQHKNMFLEQIRSKVQSFETMEDY